MSPIPVAKQPLAEGGAAPSSVLAIIGFITSQVVGITALLYYFGWTRTDSFLTYFGVDSSLAGYGTADYVLRSIAVTFQPFIIAALTALVLYGLHRLIVTPTLENSESESTPAARGVRWFVGALNAAGVALVLVVFTGVLLPEQIGVPLGFLLPLLLVVAVSLLGYTAQVRSRYPASFAPTGSRHAVPASRAYRLILLALGLIAVIWVVSLYGEHVGTDRATEIVDYLSDEPSVTVYSTERIAIAGPGVVDADISQAGSKYHYQYSGLRLLLHSPDKYLLLPAGWRHGQDPVFVLHDDNTIRVDITAR